MPSALQQLPGYEKEMRDQLLQVKCLKWVNAPKAFKNLPVVGHAAEMVYVARQIKVVVFQF
jgi:hypothetical protein